MSAALLNELAGALAGDGVRVVDLSQTLSPRFPQIVLPPEFGQCAPFRLEEISRYDERGPGWYWNNLSFGEHTGTHFDAPVHWITGRDLPDNTTESLPPQSLIAPACVIDCTPEAARDADFLLTAEHVREAVTRLKVQYRDEPLGAVTFSLGIAVYPEHGTTPEALMRTADLALYRAKALGRNRVVVGEVAADPTHLP